MQKVSLSLNLLVGSRLGGGLVSRESHKKSLHVVCVTCLDLGFTAYKEKQEENQRKTSENKWRNMNGKTLKHSKSEEESSECLFENWQRKPLCSRLSGESFLQKSTLPAGTRVYPTCPIRSTCKFN